MLNPWLALALVLALGGAYAGGRYDGQRLEAGAQRRAEDAARDTREIALSETAKAIAGIRVTHTTIRQQAEREIRYALPEDDSPCDYPDALFGVLRSAYAAQRPGSARDPGLQPGVAAAGGSEPGGGAQRAAAGDPGLF